MIASFLCVAWSRHYIVSDILYEEIFDTDFFYQQEIWTKLFLVYFPTHFHIVPKGIKEYPQEEVSTALTGLREMMNHGSEMLAFKILVSLE